LLAQLRAVEPSNAETLAAALDRQRSLRASYERIECSPDLLRPIIAVKDVAARERGRRRQITETVFDSFARRRSICPLLPLLRPHRFVSGLAHRRAGRPPASASLCPLRASLVVAQCRVESAQSHAARPGTALLFSGPEVRIHFPSSAKHKAIRHF
jgi:hypothetical protein